MSRSAFVTAMTPPGESDSAVGQPLPPHGREQYLKVELPEHFVVEVVSDRGRWLGGNSHLREECSRLEDGSYVCGGRGGGSPLTIRCVAHLPDSFIHLDGGGRPWRYRLQPVPVPGAVPSASMFEVGCGCGAVLSVFSRRVERPRVECPRCGREADSELAAGEPWDEQGFDEEGPDVQVQVAWEPRG